MVAAPDFGIWRAFGNEAWPALYFIGARRLHPASRRWVRAIYDQSERLIQQLLCGSPFIEAGDATVAMDVADVSGEGAQAEKPTRNNLRSN